MQRRMGNSVWCLLLGLSLSVDSRAAPHPAGSDPELAKGIQQVNDGDLEAAIATLDGVLARAGSDPNRAPEAAQAHLYKGIVFASLERADDARGSFVEALKRNWLLHLDPGRFPPKVTEVFGAAREEARRLGYEPAKPSQKPAIGGLGVLGIVAGVLALGGAAAALGGDSNAPPTVAASAAPEGTAIAGVTVVTFTASGSDPDGDSLTYRWEFGDGAIGDGATVNHVFATPGTFTVTVSARDGKSQATARTSVSVGVLTGLWVRQDRNCTLELQQMGPLLSGSVKCGRSAVGVPLFHDGRVLDPRRVVFRVSYSSFSFERYELAADSSLRRLDGTVDDFTGFPRNIVLLRL